MNLNDFRRDLFEEITSLYYEIGYDEALEEYENYSTKFTAITGLPLITPEIDAFFTARAKD